MCQCCTTVKTSVCVTATTTTYDPEHRSSGNEQMQSSDDEFKRTQLQKGDEAPLDELLMCGLVGDVLMVIDLLTHLFPFRFVELESRIKARVKISRITK